MITRSKLFNNISSSCFYFLFGLWSRLINLIIPLTKIIYLVNTDNEFRDAASPTLGSA